MFKHSKLAKSIRLAFVAGLTSAAIVISPISIAQQAQNDPSQSANQQAETDTTERIAVTGSRIRRPGAVSASPIFSMDAEELDYFQEPEIEKIIRVLPGTIPGDGANANNGSAGAATVDLRGLGPQRTLVLMNGRRLVPFNFNGQVDTAIIPTALVDRVDVVTGGASAVYGSDAIAGAINFVMKNNFEGVAFEATHSQTGESDGDIDNMSLTLGSSLADDQGNVALSLSWMNRDQVLLGQRPLGLLGIDTASGANYQEFLNGQPPISAPAGCGGPNIVGSGGSTTAIPTRFAIVGGGAASAGQFREDGTIGSECSVFNFNPFNFYQTPQERYSAMAIAHYDINDDVRIYTSANFSNTTVDTQVAPSGTFGESFDLPLANPLIGDQARQFMIDAGNTALANGLLLTTGAAPNWQDINNNGVVDQADYLLVQLRRRTVELGARTELFDTDQFQLVAGVNGTLYEDWEFDISYQYGESNRVTTRGGYTNLTNIQNALDTTDGVTCKNGDSSCVPIDLFGGFGTITEAMAGYATAIALQTQKYDQTVANLTINGPIEFIEIPGANAPLSVSFGYEYRQERGSLEPDECLKQAPSSCQGGAGGNLLPISGGFKVDEYFIEGVLPIFDGQSFAETLDIEFAYRAADYDSVGSNNTWKFGFSWRPVEDFLVRVMKQSATRAPNVGEIASPVVTGLSNAKQDPCSVANAANIDATLRQLCISTGMSDAQVGQVQNVISGQVNNFNGSDPNALPGAEEADTFTAGIVWTSDLLENLSVTIDYYDIDIKGVIGNFSAQEVLDACYIGGVVSECSKIKRIGGDLTISGAGIQLFTTNLNFQRAEGIEVGINFLVGLDDWGDLKFSANINKYLTQESQSSDLAAVIDCKGFYGTSCNPISDLRWIQRTTWDWEDLTVSVQWRHIGSVDVEPVEASGVFEAFRHIDSYDYIDLFASYHFGEHWTFTAGVDNLFDKEPPVLGNEIGTTTFNSGNTYPSNYDVLGRIYKVGFKLEF